MSTTGIAQSLDLYKKVPLLNAGYIRLVDYMGSDLAVVRSARVSYDADWRAGSNTGSDERLINYMWSHRHVSPFDAVVLQWEVEAPIFVFRQWMRHWSWRFNEISGRYTELKEDYYVPRLEHIAAQSVANKQSRQEDNPLAAGDAMDVQALVKASNSNAFAAYKRLLTMGVSREIARTVLPLGTYSRLFATVSLRDCLFFLTQRTDLHAQLEIRVYAEEIKKKLYQIVPVTMAAYDRYKWELVDTLAATNPDEQDRGA